MQSSESDCGPAALLTVLRHYGSNAALVDLQLKYVSDPRGATLRDLSRAAADHGFDSLAARGTLEDLQKEPMPCVAHVINGAGQPHFVAIFSIGKKVHIGDPAFGSRRITRAEFERVWVSRAVLLIRPPKNGSAAAHSGIRAWLHAQLAPLSQFWWLLGLTSVIGTGLTLLWSLVIARTLNSAQGSGKGDHVRLALGLLALAFVRGALTWLRSRLAETAGEELGESLRGRLGQIVRKIPANMMRSNTAGIVRARLADIQQVNSSAIRAVTLLAADAVLVVASMVALVVISPLYLGVATALTSLLVAWLLFRSSSFREARFDYLAKARLVDDRVVELTRALPELRGVGCEEFAVDRMLASTNAVSRVASTLGRQASSTSLMTEIFTNILLASVALVGAFAVASGKVPATTAFLLFVIASTSVPGIIRIVESIESVQLALLSAGRLYEADATADVPAEADHVTDVEFIELLDVGKSTNDGRVLFRGVTQRLDRGTITVISGASGSGKSLLLSLIARTASPNAGAVFAAKRSDGRIVREPIGRVPIVPAAPAQFSASVLENISLGRQSVDRRKVEELVAKLELESLVQSFPQGLDTPLQSQPPSATGGQAQLIGILRALLSESPVLLLDDCLSAIDLEVSSRLIKRIAGLPSRPIVVIACNAPAVIASSHNHLHLKGY